MPDRRKTNFKGPEKKHTYQIQRAEGPPVTEMEKKGTENQETMKLEG